DALVADGLSELQSDVKAGRLTQAQADAMKSQVTQRATDQVNNGLRGPARAGGSDRRQPEPVRDTPGVAPAYVTLLARRRPALAGIADGRGYGLREALVRPRGLVAAPRFLQLLPDR